LNNTLLNDQWTIEEIREGGATKNFLESNETFIYQNLWDAEKVGLRGKFIPISAYIKNQI
jgi:hypothetical protein